MPNGSGRLSPGSFEMLTCPYCQQQAMTQLQKSVIGPVRSRPCHACGMNVSVHWAGVLMVFPFLLGVFVAAAIGPSWPAIAPLALGTLAMFAIHAWWVPLVARAS
ncbi:MAG: hypothetical protein NT117_09705 [Gammaproteobacteria bacterium]|nr:hypothetical protein [Gammaproteobacteria bacterium]